MPAKALVLAGLLLAIGGCGLRRQSASPLGLNGAENREQPALSGDGRLLASLVERGGRTTVLLQERRSGKVLPLRHLKRHQPHSSPSLSWNGRYLALLIQRGARREAVIEDRANGALQPLFLPGNAEPRRLSLAPDARQLAVELTAQGSTRLQIYDHSGLLEPDLAPGQRESGGGPGVEP